MKVCSGFLSLLFFLLLGSCGEDAPVLDRIMGESDPLKRAALWFQYAEAQVAEAEKNPEAMERAEAAFERVIQLPGDLKKPARHNLEWIRKQKNEDQQDQDQQEQQEQQNQDSQDQQDSQGQKSEDLPKEENPQKPRDLSKEIQEKEEGAMDELKKITQQEDSRQKEQAQVFQILPVERDW